jgi:tetrahydromethanopterin S-methyltransferase subunit C
VGALVGNFVGTLVGALVGVLVGTFVGALIGALVGALVGCQDPPLVGTHTGEQGKEYLYISFFPVSLDGLQ